MVNFRKRALRKFIQTFMKRMQTNHHYLGNEEVWHGGETSRKTNHRGGNRTNSISPGGNGTVCTFDCDTHGLLAHGHCVDQPTFRNPELQRKALRVAGLFECACAEPSIASPPQLFSHTPGFRAPAMVRRFEPPHTLTTFRSS